MRIVYGRQRERSIGIYHSHILLVLISRCDWLLCSDGEIDQINWIKCAQQSRFVVRFVFCRQFIVSVQLVFAPWPRKYSAHLIAKVSARYLCALFLFSCHRNELNHLTKNKSKSLNEKIISNRISNTKISVRKQDIYTYFEMNLCCLRSSVGPVIWWGLFIIHAFIHCDGVVYLFILLSRCTRFPFFYFINRDLATEQQQVSHCECVYACMMMMTFTWNIFSIY